MKKDYNSSLQVKHQAPTYAENGTTTRCCKFHLLFHQQKDVETCYKFVFSSIAKYIFNYSFFRFKMVKVHQGIDFTAIFISSFSLHRWSFLLAFAKYLPASSIVPMELIPQFTSCYMNSSCISFYKPHQMQHAGVTAIFGFIDICAIPYSSINQPIAFTHF